MKNRSASPSRLSLLWLACLPATAALAQTTTVATNPVGYIQTQCLGNSDTLVALPFTRMPAFTGAVLTSPTTPTDNVVKIANTPGFTPSQFVQTQPGVTPAQADTFYLTVGPGSQALTGTLSVTQGSAAVAGTNTTFTSQLVVGDRVTLNDGYNQLTYTVAGIADNFNLTFDRPFGDAAAPAAVAPLPVSQLTAVTAKKAGKISTLTRAGSVAQTTAVVGPQQPVTTKPKANATSFPGLSATFDHSPLEGRWYLVTANDAGSVTVTLNGDSLTSLAAGTQVSIIPCWTLNTLYPAANAGVSFTPTTDSSHRNTQVLIPDYQTADINLSSAATYYYIKDGTNMGWRLFGADPSADAGNAPMMPDGYLTVRQDNNSPTVTMTFNGSVPINKLVSPLATDQKRYVDNALGLNRPADVKLGSLGLNVADGSLQATTLGSTSDQLFVYNNSETSLNKSAYYTYYYIADGTNVGWRLFGDDPSLDKGSIIIPAGSAITLRKAPTATGKTVMWSNSPNY